MTTENEWIDHDGGPIPVKPSTMVYVRFEDGSDDGNHHPAPAGYWASDIIGLCSWACRNGEDGIIAYRVVQS